MRVLTCKKFTKRLPKPKAPAAPADRVGEEQAPPPPPRNEYDTAKAQLDTYFCPKRNSNYEVYVFRQTKQQSGETLDQFHTRLRQLAETCEFTHIDREVKIQILHGCTSSRMRRRALRDPKLTLSDLLSHGRALEMSETQASGIEKASFGSSREVNHLHFYKQHTRCHHHQKPSGKGSNRCRNCGGQWPHEDGRTSCPAYGTGVLQFGKSNH